MFKWFEVTYVWRNAKGEDVKTYVMAYAKNQTHAIAEAAFDLAERNEFTNQFSAREVNPYEMPVEAFNNAIM